MGGVFYYAASSSMVRLLPPFRGEKQWHYHHQPSTILELWQHENDTWTQSLFTLWHCRCSLHKVYIRANRLNTYNMSKLNSYFRVRCCEIIQNVSFEYHKKIIEKFVKLCFHLNCKTPFILTRFFSQQNWKFEFWFEKEVI